MKLKITKKSKIQLFNPKDEKDSIEFIITQPSIANKSDKVFGYINEILESDENKQWYYMILKKFIASQDHDIIYNEFLDKAIDIASKFTKKKEEEIVFSSFVNRSKKTDNSTLFVEEDIYEIYFLSSIIKLISVFSSTSLVEQKQDHMNKMVFSYIVEKQSFKRIVDKIHDVVYRKLFRCIGMDPTIMKTIALRSTMSEDDFVLYLFDYVISAILVIYDMVRNPITFIVTSVDQVMIWHFRALYQKSIAYKETGELFGKSMSTTNLPEKIISDMIYDYIQELVAKKNKEFGVTILEDGYGTIDKHFYNFFVIPLFTKIFRLKTSDSDYNNFQKINIQLFLYYSLTEFMEKTDENIFPLVTEDKLVPDCRGGFNRHKFLEILKRIPVTAEEKYNVSKISVFEDDEFLLDDGARTGKNYIGFQFNGTYKIESLTELLTSKFTFYGISNIMILNNYLKAVMNVINNLVFKNIFTFDLSKNEFRSKKYSRQLELEFMPFLMVILNNKADFFTKYEEYIATSYCLNRR